MNTEPISVFDVRDDEWRDRTTEEHEALADWLRDQGVDPEESVRVEIHQDKGLFARVTQFHRDADGNLMVDYERNEAKRAAPFDVSISQPPPVAVAT